MNSFILFISSFYSIFIRRKVTLFRRFFEYFFFSRFLIRIFNSFSAIFLWNYSSRSFNKSLEWSLSNFEVSSMAMKVRIRCETGLTTIKIPEISTDDKRRFGTRFTVFFATFCVFLGFRTAINGIAFSNSCL